MNEQARWTSEWPTEPGLRPPTSRFEASPAGEVKMMDTVYRDRVLAVMRAEVAKLPSGNAGGGATIEYTLDALSFDSDVEVAVGCETCEANVYEHKTLANGMILTTLAGVAMMEIPEDGEPETTDVYIVRCQ